MSTIDQSSSEPRPEVPGIPPDAPESIVAASQGATKEIASEKDALDWLLGATTRLEHDVPVKFETTDGLVELVFHIQQLDGMRLEQIEEEHRNGDGPFAKLDTLAYNAHVVSEATLYIASESGRRIEPKSEAFIAGHPMGAIGAMQGRFKYQPGILAGVEAEIRKLAAYSNDRVGSAQRSLVAAAGNSSS